MEQNAIMKLLDYAYNTAINGLPGFDDAESMAEDYLKKDGDLNSQVNSLINWQTAKAGTSGFLSGLGGIIVLPVAIPANIASVMLLQVRMIAAIAHMGGHNLQDDKVKTLVYACLAGNGAKEILKNTGIQVGKKVGVQAIKNIPGKVLVAINQKVGFRLVTKFGEKGIVNLVKLVPLLGGIIGGSVDIASTSIVGNTAKNIFINNKV